MSTATISEADIAAELPAARAWLPLLNAFYARTDAAEARGEDPSGYPADYMAWVLADEAPHQIDRRSRLRDARDVALARAVRERRAAGEG